MIFAGAERGQQTKVGLPRFVERATIHLSGEGLSLMRLIRLLLCLFFAFLGALTVFFMVTMLFPALQSGHNWHGRSRVVGTVEYELLLLPFATVFGMAWWTVFMQRNWARTWAVAASVILLFMFTILLIKESFTGYGALLGLAGALGLVAFARRSTILEHQEPCEE